MNKQKLFKYSENTFIVVAHLILLKWIFYALYQGGTLSTKELVLHFTGMALYGAFLIIGCAHLYKYRYLKEQNQ